MASSSKIRTRCSFPVILLSFLNLILFLLSAASLAPIVFLKLPPTSLGWGLLTVSCISIFSSFIGFYSQLTSFCFVTHVSLLLTSSAGQMLAIFALFTREGPTIRALRSPRDPRETKLLVRMECGALMAMFVMQMGILMLTCAVHSCWVREYESFEADREAVERKRSARIARVQEESMANAAKLAEVKSMEFDEKMKNKYGHHGQWVKTDFRA